MDQRGIRISKYISLILRHHPEAIGIDLDEHGWADVDDLIKGVQNKFPGFDREELDDVVKNNDKQRFSYDETGTNIRANQGHSIDVDVEPAECVPPQFLYHGTGRTSADSIDREGLKPMGRLYVHLSEDVSTALKVGKRHGTPMVYLVKSGEMHAQGYQFFRSKNGVYLTKHVPADYLEKQ